MMLIGTGFPVLVMRPEDLALAGMASLPELLISRTIPSDLSGFLESDRPANSHFTRSTLQTKGTDQ